MKFIQAVAFLFLVTTLSAQEQPSQESKGEKSRLSEIEKMYKFSKSQLLVLDSIRSPELNTVEIKASTEKKITLDGLMISQVVVPIKAQIVRDSASGTYNEVIEYRAITTVVSEKHEPGSMKVFMDRTKEEKKKAAIAMKKQADDLRKQAEDLEKEN